MNKQGTKIVFLNSWAHRQSDVLHKFLQSTGADVICLTEVTDVAVEKVAAAGHNLVYTGDEAAAQMDGKEQLEQLFGDNHFIRYNTPERRPWECIKTGIKFSNVGFGSALMIQHGVDIIADGWVLIDFSHYPTEQGRRSRILQWVVYEKDGEVYLVAHFHGLWIRENTKGDHPARNYQSLVVREALRNLEVEFGVQKVILGGDFNLDINTNALLLLERGANMADTGEYQNLIRHFGITSTRTPLYRHFYDETASHYADYVLVSGAVEVDSFNVETSVLASDHAPLIVECV